MTPSVGTLFEDYTVGTTLFDGPCCTSGLKGSEIARHFQNGSLYSQKWRCWHFLIVRWRILMKNWEISWFSWIFMKNWEIHDLEVILLYFWVGKFSGFPCLSVYLRVFSVSPSRAQRRFCFMLPRNPDGGHGYPVGSAPWNTTHYPGYLHPRAPPLLM